MTKSYLKYYLATIVAKNNLDRKNTSQAGFSIPLALGIGLVMIIVAATTIVRSQSDRTIANSQRETNRASSVSETGLIRVKAFLDLHKLLATKDLDLWETTLINLPSIQSSCRSINYVPATQQAGVFKNHTWIDLDSRDRNKGRYKIVDYRYQNGIGKLTVAGEIDAYNTTQNSSSSSITVEIPIGSEAANISPPALWAQTLNISPNQKITGQIRAVDCPQLPAIDPDGIAGVSPNNIAIISSIPSGQIIGDPFTPIPAPKVVPSYAMPIPAITTSIRLPRVGSIDLPDARGEYNYVVDIDSLSSGYSIKLQDLDRIQIDVITGQKVNLYLKGNIDFAGSQTINVDPTHPNLRIYGSSLTTRLSIKSTASITAFIHAPLADAQSIMATPPNLSSGILGAIWVKSWDSATSQNELPIVRAGNWADFGFAASEQPSQLGQIINWQRSASQ
jgi:hypothetical protein